MLESLKVKNLALLEEVEIEAPPGLSCLTGETGAGKSLLIGAIQAIHGARMDKDWIRSGAEEAVIEAVFTQVYDCLNPELQAIYFPEMDPESGAKPGLDEDLLILRREIRREGRSVSRVNGKQVTLRELRALGQELGEIHGQHEQQRIFDEGEQMKLLDRMGGDALATARARYRATRSALIAKEKEAASLLADPEKRRRLSRLLDRQVAALDEAELRRGEVQSLQKKLRLYRAARQTSEEMARALHDLDAEGGDAETGQGAGALTQLSQGLGRLRDIRARAGLAALDPVLESLEAQEDQLMEALSDLRAIARSLDFDPEAEAQANARLQKLMDLEHQFDRSIDDLLDYREVLEAKRQQLVDSEDAQKKVLREIEALRFELDAAGQALSDLRHETGERLEQGVQAVLKDLALPLARFGLEWETIPPGPSGIDDLRFTFTANPGEPAKPLASVASGGEASRLMLAIKVVLAEADQIPLLIFDEVDQGISGDTATEIGKQLARLGENHQVLCVTHQAQVAVQADAHFYLSKEVRDGRTRTVLRPLDEAGRLRELARLLGSSLAPEEAMELAASMRKQVLEERGEACN